MRPAGDFTGLESVQCFKPSSNCLRGYSINESGFGFIVSPDLDSVIKCIRLKSLDSNSVTSA